MVRGPEQHRSRSGVEQNRSRGRSGAWHVGTDSHEAPDSGPQREVGPGSTSTIKESNSFGSGKVSLSSGPELMPRGWLNQGEQSCLNQKVLMLDIHSTNTLHQNARDRGHARAVVCTRNSPLFGEQLYRPPGEGPGRLP